MKMIKKIIKKKQLGKDEEMKKIGVIRSMENIVKEMIIE